MPPADRLYPCRTFLRVRPSTPARGVSAVMIFITLKYWTKHLRITFPFLVNISGYAGDYFGVVKPGQFVFERPTVIMDKNGIVRYIKDGSSSSEEILPFLRKLNEQEPGK